MKRKDAKVLNEAFRRAFAKARKGVRKGHGGPFGAAIICDGKIIAFGHNTVVRDSDPTAHAEMNAMRNAAKKLGTPHLEKCVLVTTSEPCDMCRDAAVLWARVSEIWYALSCEEAEKIGFREHVPSSRKGMPSSVFMCDDPTFRTMGLGVFDEWKRRKGKTY